MSEWEPATEAEIAMRDALRANDQEQYFRILARTDVLLPIAPDSSPAGEGGWGTWTTEGRTHVLAFTSPSALQECLAGHPGTHRRVPFRDLAGIWPNVEWWLAVNPGLPIEGYLPSWFVTQISRGDVRLPGRTLGARARMDQAASRTRAVAQVPLRSVPNQPAPTPIERQRMKADQTGQLGQTGPAAAASGSTPAAYAAPAAPYTPPPAVPPAAPPRPTSGAGSLRSPGPSSVPLSSVPPRRDIPPPDVAPPGAFLPTRADRPVNFERSAGRSSYAPPPASGQPASGQQHTGQPYSGQQHTGQPYSGQPAPGQPVSGQSLAGQPHFGQAASGQSFAGQSFPGQPVSGQQVSGQPGETGGAPTSGAPTSGGGSARGRASFPGAASPGLFEDSDRRSLDMPGERELFTGLDRGPAARADLPTRPVARADVPTRSQNGAPPSGLPTRPVGGDPGLPSRPVGGESGLPTRPVGGESGLPSRPVGGESGLPTRPVGGEPGLPQRPVSGASGLPQRPIGGGEPGLPARPVSGGGSGLPSRPLGGDPGLPSRPVGGESGLPSRPVGGGEPGLASRPLGGESGLPARPGGGGEQPRRDEVGEDGDPRRYWPRREPARSLGEIFTEHAEPVIPAAWQPPPDLPASSGPPLPTRQPQGEPPAAFRPADPLPSRPVSGDPLPSRPRSGAPLPSRPGSGSGSGEPAAYGFGEPSPGRPVSGESLPSRPVSGELLPSRPTSRESLPSRPVSGESLPSRPVSGGAGTYRAAEPLPMRPGLVDPGAFGAAEPGAAAGERSVGGDVPPLSEETQPIRAGWDSSADVRPGRPGLAVRGGGGGFPATDEPGGGEGSRGDDRPRGDETPRGGEGSRGGEGPGREVPSGAGPLPFDRPVFDRPGFSRLDIERPEVDEAPEPAPFGDVAARARSAGFAGADLDEHPFFADGPDPAGAREAERGLFPARPETTSEPAQEPAAQPWPGAGTEPRPAAAGAWQGSVAEPVQEPWPGAQAESRQEPWPGAQAESRQEPWPGAQAESRQEPWPGAQAEPRPESRQEPSTGAQAEQRQESWPGVQAEPWPEAQAESRQESRSEAQAEPRQEPWPGEQAESRQDSWSGAKPEARPDGGDEGSLFSGRAEVQSPFFQDRSSTQRSFFGEAPGAQPAGEDEQRPFFEDLPEPAAFNAFGEARADDPPIRDPYAALAELRSEPEPGEEPAQLSFASGAEALAETSATELQAEKENTGSFFVPPAVREGVRAGDEPSPELRTFFEEGEADRPDFQQDFVPGADQEPGQAQPATTFQAEQPGRYQAEPAAAYQAEPAAAYQAEPVSAYQAEPAAVYQAEPVTVYQAEPAAGYRADPDTTYHVESSRERTPEPVYEPEIVDSAPVRLHDEIVDAEVIVPAPPVVVKAADVDFKPANNVERDLLEAVQDNSTDRFLSTLLLAKVLVPFWTGDGPVDPANWRTEHMNGLPHLVVFTSQERMVERLGADAQGSWIKFTRLIRNWPPGDQLAFAINPESPAGAVLPGTEVVQLASWATELGLGVDDPDDQPATEAPKPAPPPEKRPAYEPPGSGREQVMQKPISPEQLSHYLERNYDRVSGFVHRAGEVGHLQTPEQLYNALGLGYAGSSFKPDADEAYVLRWIAYRGDLYRIPYGGSSHDAMRAMEGWVIERPPFRGNGFAPSETNDVIAEFKVDSARLPHNAELWRVRRDGRQDLIARLDADGPAWRRVGSS